METPLENRMLEIQNESLRNLSATTKWTRFLAILGFISTGLILVIGVIAGIFLSVFSLGKVQGGLSDTIMVIIFLSLAVVLFFPALFLYNFSKNTAIAIKKLDPKELNKAFRNLKQFFLYAGILIIVLITAYFAALIVAGSTMSLI